MGGAHARQTPADSGSTPRRGFWRSPITWAAGAVLLAGALVAAPGTYAFLNDTASTPKATITAAPGITATATAAVALVPVVPASTANFATGATGMVPGVRSQRFTFTVTSGATDIAQSYVNGTVTLKDASALALFDAGKLTVAATGSANCAVAAPARASGTLTIAVSPAPNTTLRPGAACTVTVDVAIPAHLGQDPAVRALRGASAGAVQLAATLSQVPRAEEK